MKRLVCLFVCALALLGRAEAANRIVCASGCQYTSLQQAINDAVPGDTILLRAGETFVGNFMLRAKSGTSTSFITIRSDASDSSLPAAGVRLVPEGKPGANVTRSLLPRLLGQGGFWRSTPVIRTEAGAHHYRLQFLEIDGGANEGYETLIQLGVNSSTQTASNAPHSLVLDRLHIHGHPTKGIKRGVALDSRLTDVINSYINDIKSVSEAQAIAGFNGAGPFNIINNYLEGTAENILFGGSDPKTPNLVPSDIQIRQNHFYKPLSWQNPIMPPPTSVTVSAGGGGSLPAGTHYFKVVAVNWMGGDPTYSAPSVETAVTVGSGGSVTLMWKSVAGADYYRVYRGTSSNGQNVYVETKTPGATALLYTGSGQLSGAPQAQGTLWPTKNLLELKNAQRVVVDGNVFQNTWQGFQAGYGFMLTPRNQEGTAPWSVVRDVTITNNIISGVGSGFGILGYDDAGVSQQTRNIKIANNVVGIVGGSFGEGRFVTITRGPANITIDHNTIFHTSNAVTVAGALVYGFVYTNNLSLHNMYGVHGQNRAPGIDTLNAYFPSYVFKGNVLAGGVASSYPSGNYFPTVSQFYTFFTNASGGNYSLVSTCAYNGAGTDGLDIGVDMIKLAAAQGGTYVPPPPPPPPTSGGSTGGGTSGGTTGGTLPTGWQHEDIGYVGLAGNASYSGSTFSVRGAGDDVWDTSDAFHYAHQPLTGDGSIVARVGSVSGSAPWTKVGVMIRASDAANSAYAFMLVSQGKGLAFQRRTATGVLATHTYAGAGTAPRWVKLTRQGSRITASVSLDGQAWTVVGSDTFTMPADVLVGLAVSSHDAAALATGTFDNVSIVRGQTLPAGWQSTDIGAVGATGSTSASAGTFTVKGAGADVWGSADALQFAWTTLPGDGEIIARVAALNGTQAWTKVGVMMRMSLSPGSAQAFMLVSAGKGLAFQRRTVTGGTSVHTLAGAGTAPRWVKLERQGQVITAYVSTNGTSWTTVGSDTFSISGSIYVGLAVSSHDPAALATGTFDSVVVN